MDLKAKPFYLSDEDIKWVEETKASLTLDEKLGQLFFPIGYSPNEQYLQYEILSKNPGGLMCLFVPSDKQQGSNASCS